MVTIVDVAKEAGVSIATVSRVMNKNYSVTHEKKALVMKAIEKTGYIIPDRVNQVENKSTGSIILIITGNLIEKITYAIQDTARKYNYQTITYSYRSTDDYLELKNLLAALKPSLAGIILLNAIAATPEFEELLVDYPVVQIGPPVLKSRQNYSVYSDEFAMSYDAANYLIEIGRKNIGIISFEPDSENMMTLSNRERGYFMALLEHHMDIDYEKRIYSDISIEGGYEAAHKLLEKFPDMDAIVCITGCIAEGCILALLETQHPLTTLPFSLDYSEVADISSVQCPYTNPQGEKLGTAGMEFLMDLIEKKSVTDCERIVPYEKMF